MRSDNKNKTYSIANSEMKKVVVVMCVYQYVAWVQTGGRNLIIAGGVHPMTDAPSCCTPL